MKKYIYLFLKGLAMGAVNKIPGVSGGTVAFITGIYEDLIDSIKRINFKSFKILFNRGFKDFYKEINGKFLTVLFSGVIASFFSVSLVLWTFRPGNMFLSGYRVWVKNPFLA